MKAIQTSLFLVHNETGQRYPLRSDISIGCVHGDIVFAQDTSLSKEHCRIQPTPKGVAVRDLNSKTGTTINGAKIQPGRDYLLRPGSHLQVGAQAFTLREVSLSKRSPRKRMKGKLNPSYLSLYAVLLTNLVVFAWSYLHGLPWLDPSSEQMLAAGGALNSTATHGQVWRLITSLFLHYGVVHLLCNLWALFALAEFLVAGLGDGAFLLVYFAGGFTGVLLTMGLGDGSQVAAGASCAIMALIGGLFALHLLHRLKLKRVSVYSWLAGFACATQNILFMKGQLLPLAHLGAALVGFAFVYVIDAIRADLQTWKQIPLTLTLVGVTLWTLMQQPLKGSSTLVSPLLMVQKELAEVYESYDYLKTSVERQTATPLQVSQRIQGQVLPRIEALAKRLATVPVENEGQRRVLDLEQRFVATLKGHAEATAKFQPGGDAKFQDEIDLWSEQFEQIHIEFLQQTDAAAQGLVLPTFLQSPFQVSEREMRKVIRDYHNLALAVRGNQITEAQMAENIRSALLPKIASVRARMSVILPKGETERRKLALDQRLMDGYAGQLKSMAAFADTKDPKYSKEMEKWSADLEKLASEIRPRRESQWKSQAQSQAQRPPRPRQPAGH